MRAPAIGSAAVSIVAIAFFPSGFPRALNVIGALVVDVALIVAATAYQWAPSALDG